jgi:hypothetical protein
MDEGTRRLLQIVNGGFASTERAFADKAVAHPEFVIRAGPQIIMDEKCVLGRKGFAHNRGRDGALD